MIDRIKRLFAAAGSPPPTSTEAAGEFDELHLAAAALLAEVAMGDDNFDAAERAAIGALVGNRFGLSDEDAKALVEAAEKNARD